MAIILFDDNSHQTLLPLTYTRPVADLRIGILTIAEKWAKYVNLSYSFSTADYLQEKFPLQIEERNLFINGSVCPDEELYEAILKLHGSEALVKDGLFIAVKLNQQDAEGFNANNLSAYKIVDYTGKPVTVKFPEDIFKKN